MQPVLVGAMDRTVYRDVLVHLIMCLHHVISWMEHVTVCQAILGLHVKGVNFFVVVVVVLAITGALQLSSPFNNIECPQGSYGQDCSQNCTCVAEQESSPCNHVDGMCHCLPGYNGSSCELGI